MSENLSIWNHYQEITEAVKNHQVVIIAGETGSGKTTQLPVMFRTPEFVSDCIIGITEPRRIAAVSTASYVAEQLGVELGREVAYNVRFDRQTSGDEDICFMTEGILVRELQSSADLEMYSLIIVDEAHERSINTDAILGCLKRILPNEPELRVIISSATIDTKKFSDFFDGAPVITVLGRNYPVEIHYDSTDYLPDNGYDGVGAVADPLNYIPAIAERVLQICRSNRPGDILIFVPGYQEIEMAQAAISACGLEPEIKLFRLHGDMKLEEQQEALAPANQRKVIVATNIAETSITVDGVVFVIDSGLIKQKGMDARSQFGTLRVVNHSRAGCDQRAGRAGRTRPGVCYRMFTRQSYLSRPEYTVPEIQRSNLENAVLDLMAIGIKDVRTFPFLDPPDSAMLDNALHNLALLGALDSEGNLTELGEKMARLPLAPKLSKMILAAEQFGAVEQAVIMAAALSTRSMFFLPKDSEERRLAKSRHALLVDSRSDVLTYLKIWALYQAAADKYLNKAADDQQTPTPGKWCFENYLNAKVMREIWQIRGQILSVLNQLRIKITGTNDPDLIHQAFLAGFAANFAEANPFGYNYFDRNSQAVFLQPGSVLFASRPRWVAAAEFMSAGKPDSFGCQKTFMYHAAPVDLRWLTRICPELLTKKIYWQQCYFADHGGQHHVLVAPAAYFYHNIEVSSGSEPVSGLKLTEASLSDCVRYLHEQMVRYAAGKLFEYLGANPEAAGGWEHRAHFWVHDLTQTVRQEILAQGREYSLTDQEQFFRLLARFKQSLDQLRENVEQIKQDLAVRRVQTLRQSYEQLRGQFTPELRDKVEQCRDHLNQRVLQQWQRYFQLFIDTSFDRLAESMTVDELGVLEKIKAYLPDMLRELEDAWREYNAKQAGIRWRREYEKTCQRLLQQLLAGDDWILCPVCTEFLSIQASALNQVNCRCHEPEFQAQFEFFEQERIVLLQTEYWGDIVAELVAVRTNQGFRLAVENVNTELLAADREYRTFVSWRTPARQKVEAFQQAAAYAKAKALAEEQVQAGRALLLTFSAVAAGNGSLQWQAQYRGHIYVADRAAAGQPNFGHVKWYCELGVKLGPRYAKQQFLARPFLEYRD